MEQDARDGRGAVQQGLPPAERRLRDQRAGRRGDGFFPGGWLPAAERIAQHRLMRETAEAAGRDPDALDYTRWGSLEVDPAGVEAYAAQGVDRLVLGLPAAGLDDQRRLLDEFGRRHGLRAS